MMITKIGKALAVMGALALLAMPAHALAQEGESHHEDKTRHEGEARHEDKTHHEGEQWQGKGAKSDQWYQGQRGHWYQEGNRWQWRGAEGNRPYYGQSSAESQRRRDLVNQDRTDRARYRAALKRGDKEAAEHYLKQLNSTDKMLGMTQQQINAGVLPH